MSFELSKKQSLAWSKLEDNITNEVMYGGAAGGGKSLLGAVWHIYRRTKYPGSRGLIGRSKLKSLKESTMVTLFDALSKMGYRSGVDYKYNQQENFISWSNGSKTIFKDLFAYPSDPDFQSLGSTEFTDVFIDEATEITIKAFDILKSRIRYKMGEFNLIPKIYITGNPQPGWVKERYVADDDGNKVELRENQAYIQATVFDNPDPVFVAMYRKQLEDLGSEYDKARLLYGDWDAQREIENPFCTQYDESLHVAKTEHNINRQLVISIDFNIDPFSANVFNIWNDGMMHVHQVDEIEIMGGTIDKLADEIRQRYNSQLYTLQITGDAMGNNRTIGAKDNKSLFRRLKDKLGISEHQFKIKSNPTHKASRDQVNYFLRHFPDFKISDKCVGTRRDMRVVQVDLYGSIIKRNRKDTSQRADFLDNIRYFVNTYYGKAIEKHRKVGKWY